MVAGIDRAAFDRLGDAGWLRALVALAYLAGGIIIALFFPDTPDELSRISIALQFRETGVYDFFWPPGNVFLIVINPLLGLSGLDDVTAVRLFNLGLSALPICILLAWTRSAWLLLVALFTAPYAYLVLATAAQQGVMIGLILILCWAFGQGRWLVFAGAALALYLVNPGMVLALPLALLILVVLRAEGPLPLVIACAMYLPILAAAFWIASTGGAFMPTLSGNGPMNVFLGNNPDPLAHRGVGTVDAARATLGLAADTDAMDVVKAYLVQDPVGFIGNMLTKAALYWMPWDFLRSGMGGNVTTVLFVYIGLAQVVIYATVWIQARRIDRRYLFFALAFAVAAWALYTLFFVKIRFRVPFDLLLLFAVLLGRLSPRARPA